MEREPEWSDEDRAWLLAYLAEQNEVCPGCRQPLSECRDKATAGTWSILQESCWACVPLEAVMQDAAKAKTRGRYFAVRRNA